MLKKYRVTIVIFLVQCAVSLLLFVLTHSLFGLFCTTIVLLLTTIQSFLTASNLQISRNILFPTFVVKVPVASCLLFLCLSTAPFLVSMLGGESIGQTYPDSEYNNLINLIGNTLSSVALISLFTLLLRSTALWDFIEKGYPRQDITHTVFLNLSVVAVLVFSLNELSISFAPHRLFSLYSIFNNVWIILVTYLAISGTTYLIMFLFVPRKKAGVKIFSSRNLILVEPYLVYCFAMGIMSTPGTFGFGAFCIACPVTLFVIMELFELSWFGADEEQKVGTIPFSSKTLFLLINLIIYAVITTIKLEMFALFTLLVPVGVVFVILLMVDFYKGRRERRLIVRAIQDMNNVERTSSWFDEKTRAYHKLREK